MHTKYVTRKQTSEGRMETLRRRKARADKGNQIRTRSGR